MRPWRRARGGDGGCVGNLVGNVVGNVVGEVSVVQPLTVNVLSVRKCICGATGFNLVGGLIGVIGVWYLVVSFVPMVSVIIEVGCDCGSSEESGWCGCRFRGGVGGGRCRD